MEQTAVKQLYLKLQRIEFMYQSNQIDIIEFIESKKQALYEAEKTFKEQICFAFLDGKASEVFIKPLSEYVNPVQYYRETYGKETTNN